MRFETPHDDVGYWSTLVTYRDLKNTLRRVRTTRSRQESVLETVVSNSIRETIDDTSGYIVLGEWDE